ncbi:hypothetical protein WJX72_008795 [[Myrmecia] bisecta]|uniref:uroporphyrinogen-III C-methyltransferase n=1 Tax=[Myrmecia] bisecta TaxID=41462 RepID=A0AAW1QAL2_9CHLO
MRRHCGSGPTDYLTIKAMRLIQAADVIVYDDLGAQEAVEEFAAPAAERIYVGKRGQKQSIKQDAINEILVEHCSKGKQVVRLKGGCVSVFSRASSEMAALAEAGISFELVPGISSTLSAPLFAGFPVTDANCGQSFAVTSAHKPEDTQWRAFRGIDTLVLLMAGSTLPRVVELLRGAEWDMQTQVAVVRWAGTQDQQVWKGTLETIVTDTASAGPLSPCVVIVGNVVSLSH